MDNLQPVSHLDPHDVPEGFTVTDPNRAGGVSSADNDGTTGSSSNSSKEAQRQSILEQALESDAMVRLNRIKLVKPEKALQVSNAIVSMALSGKLPGRISEGKLIELLERGSAADARAAHANNKHCIQIQRKKYAMDSDEEDDDNDDDL